MDIAIVTLRLLAVSQVLLFSLVLWFSPNSLAVRSSGAALLVGIVCYLIAPLVAEHLVGLPIVTVNTLATLVPSLLLLFVWLLFEESKFPPWLLMFVGVSVVVTTVYFSNCCGPLLADVASISLPLLKMVAFGFVVMIIWQGRDNDLVPLRRKMRDALVASILLIAVGVVVVELVSGFEVPKLLETYGMGVIFASAILFNLIFIRLNPTAKLEGEPPLKIAPPSNDPIVSKLLKRMKEERLYADHDLRVASLADVLRVPEYQLRKRINQHLGYRNFNQFVNHYRVEEAAQRLQDEPTLPVLTIALDVGFRSISSFNTSFLAHFGESPTQYRASAKLD